MARVLVVINPVAGSVRPARVHAALTEWLPEGSYSVYETTGREDLPALVRARCAEGLNTVIAVGGDGTVGRVAAGLVGTEVRLAVLPSGTSNVLAHDAGIPERLEEALALVTEDAPVMRIDAMQVGASYAFLNVSLGLSVGVLRDADQQRKRRLGRLAYIWSGIKNLAAVGVHTVRLAVDGREYVLRTSEVLITNCPSLGAPELSLSDDVRMDDGRIEVVTFRARHLKDYAGLAIDLLLRRTRRRRHIRTFVAEREIAVVTETVMDVQMDGDVVAKTPVTVRVVPNAVRLISPRGQRATARAR